jgi:rifampin ADP-ribosylating transferase
LSVTSTPERFQVHESGVYFHGTKADLSVGDLLVPGRPSNYEEGRIMNHIYVTRTLDGAVWAAEMAKGNGPGRIYIVEPQGELEDDPNVTDKKFPGNPTHSYRSRQPVKIVGEFTDWVGHPPEALQEFRDGLADLRHRGLDVIYD